jgi:hypothetical protein
MDYYVATALECKARRENFGRRSSGLTYWLHTVCPAWLRSDLWEEDLAPDQTASMRRGGREAPFRI